MKHLFIASIVWLTASLCFGQSLEFGYTRNIEVVKAKVEKERITGKFWTEWVVEKGCQQPTRPVMEAFSAPLALTNHMNRFWLEIGSATNYVHVWTCEREHIDRTPQEEATYTQSNLVAYLVWRNRTNVNYLESICVSTNRVKWHWEKTKVIDSQ